MITRRRRRGRAVSLLLVAAVAATLAGPVTRIAAHSPDPALGGDTFVQDGRLLYDWRTGAVPPAAMRTAINAAAADVGDTRASRAATFDFDTAGANPIGYGTGTCGVNGLACFTRDAPNGFTMWFREQGRVFDWGTLKWCQMYTDAPSGCYDVETIALDEFGHVEGLGHHVNYSDDSDYTDAVVQTYSRTRPRAGYNMHVLGVCDVAQLQIRYDIPGASSKYSTCLDVATVMTLSRSAASVVYGGNVTFTATLKVVTDTAYGRLSGNPVSGRAVRLQRRPPGTTTWSNFATMTATSPTGSYVVSTRLYSSAEFRAVFSAPTNEGLRADGSPAVAVAVGSCTTAPCPLSTGR
ncbi:MAG: hypothetical protein QOI52_902 [Chloroflexota bacterium]|jgi:hypothetical protein|nr:hypothetical protein [Chloroflexota bacterium]